MAVVAEAAIVVPGVDLAELVDLEELEEEESRGPGRSDVPAITLCRFMAAGIVNLKYDWHFIITKILI